MKKGLGLALLGFALGAFAGVLVWPLFGPARESAEIRATYSVNQPKDIEFLLRQIDTVRAKDDQGNIRGFRVATTNPTGQGYTLDLARPLKIPDHHGCAELHLVQVRDNRALVGYQWVFDHRSFGRNLTTISSGLAEIDLVPEIITNFVPTKIAAYGTAKYVLVFLENGERLVELVLPRTEKLRSGIWSANVNTKEVVAVLYTGSNVWEKVLVSVVGPVPPAIPEKVMDQKVMASGGSVSCEGVPVIGGNPHSESITVQGFDLVFPGMRMVMSKSVKTAVCIPPP